MTSLIEHQKTLDDALRRRAQAVIPGGMYGHQNAGPLPPEFPQFLERGDGRFVFPLVRKGHSQRRQNAGVTRIHLGSLFQNALCLHPVVETQVQHALHKEHVGVPRRKPHRFAHVLLSLSQLVFA